MTRQKKEIIRKIAELDREIAVDMALAFGQVPEDAYKAQQETIDMLQEELARLSHFNSYIEYVMDPRWRHCGADELPFG